MNPKKSEKLHYKFENFMAKGGRSIFISLLILFFGGFLLVGLIRFATTLIFPDLDPFSSFFEHIWLTFLEMTDPGNMARDTDHSAVYKVSGVLAGLIGVIIVSMLIAFITTQLERVLRNFRRGRSRVLEQGHTLILGWNERVVDIIRELIIANESEDDASIVILSEEPKEDMDDAIQAAFPDSKGTKIITRHGSSARLIDLARVNPSKAKSAIVLASASQSETFDEKQASDAHTLKTLLAILENDPDHSINIVVELLLEQNRNVLPVFNSDKIISLNSWDILGKLIVQTSITSGLSVVYNEILSFDGCELYIHHDDWKGLSFYELAYYLKDGVPLGVCRADGKITMRPEKDFQLEETDHVIILAQDDSTIELADKSLVEDSDLIFSEKQSEPLNTKRQLIMGWHTVVSTIVNESVDYLGEGAQIDILTHEPTEHVKQEFEQLKALNSGVKMNLIDADALSIKSLEKANPFTYDTVILLSQNEGKADIERLDAQTLVTLLLLRTLAKQHPKEAQSTKIITQILNSDNEELMTQADVDDFIISNKVITQLFAQVSENPEMLNVYEEIFKEEGSEIYLKPLDLFLADFSREFTFGDLMMAAEHREEICLGLRLDEHANDPKKNFGVILDPPKDQRFTLTAKDSLVVLAEDAE